MPLQLSTHIEDWPTQAPFRITGHTWDRFRVVIAEVTDGVHLGRGEAFGVYYLGESTESLCQQIDSVAVHVKNGLDRNALMDVLPPGGARNALDCALWDFEAKASGRRIWTLLGLAVRSLTTSMTIGIEDTPEKMAQVADRFKAWPVLKIKLDNEQPVERVRAIRARRPDAMLTVDANQGWSFDQLQAIAPQLESLGVKWIEQPLPRGEDAQLERYRSPVPLCADESCQHEGDLAAVARHYQMVNIKLDKVGGLTAAIRLAEEAKYAGLDVLASCMLGTSLGMAPGFVFAQHAHHVELDSHLLLKHDRFPALVCNDGELALPDRHLWG